MRLLPAIYTLSLLRIGLIAMALVAVAFAGALGFIYPISFSPLFILGVLAIFALLISWLRRPVWALYASLFIVLLPIGLFPASIQSNLNRFLTVVALIVWGVSILFRRQRIIWTSTGLFMISFLVWCLLTLLWAPNLEAGKNVLGGYTLRFVLFLFLFANEINTQETLDGLMSTLATAGWVFIIVGIGTLLVQGYEFGTRMEVVGGNENTLGGLFPVVVVGVIWLVIRSTGSKKAFWILLSFAFILLSFILVALSGSRGSAISWFITILALLFWRQTRIWGIVGLLILSIAIIVAPFILSTTINRFIGGTGDTFFGGREVLWQASWQLIRDKPIKGAGIGNATYALIPYLRMYRSVLGYEQAAIHNPILAIWAEIGLPGLLLYLATLLSAVCMFVRQYLGIQMKGKHSLIPYHALIFSAFFGYITSWIKGGGGELSHTYFLLLALLVLPSVFGSELITQSIVTYRAKAMDNPVANPTILG